MTFVDSRPPKLSHAQTVLYEIDLLRHTAESLAAGKWKNDIDRWICLESFLLHFRNLIEFFGPLPRTRNGPNQTRNLSIHSPHQFWPDESTRPSATALNALCRIDLWEKYENDNDYPQQRISRYLQHCTEMRVEPLEGGWRVGLMYNEIKDLLDTFENLLPDKTRPWTTSALTVRSVVDGSVSVGTGTVESFDVFSDAEGGNDVALQSMTLDEIKEKALSLGCTKVQRQLENARVVELKDWKGFAPHISGAMFAQVDYYLEGNKANGFKIRVHKALEDGDHWYALS